MIINFPYGKRKLEVNLPDEKVLSVVRPLVVEPACNDTEEINRALSNPIRSEKLTDIASKGKKVCIIVSDYTRATPNSVLVPPILGNLRKAGCKMDNINIIVANGMHKPASHVFALEEFLGKSLMEEVNIVNHNAENADELAHIGKTPFGTDVSINKLIVGSDLVIATGLIEPHFFAGYSGGRKSILPGVAGKTSIFQNHCFKMVGHPNSRYGVLDGNPIHKDMVEASKMARLNYLLNVILNEGKVVRAYAGHPYEAHEKGVEFLNKMAKIEVPLEAEIVVTSNGGYPLDRDLYQAVKSMATAELVVKKGGVIIVLSECIDGVGRGHESFYQLMAERKSHDEILKEISKDEPLKDQWEVQILSRILNIADVIVVTRHVKHSTIEEMHLIPASSMEEALTLADELSTKRSKITAIPNGPYVIPHLKAGS